MNQMIGASVEDLRGLGKAMTRDAERIQSVLAELRATPRQVWVGADSQQFFAEVESSLVPQLNAVVDGLCSASEALRRNAHDQEQNSATLDGSGPSVGGAAVPKADGGVTPGFGATRQFDEISRLITMGLDVTGWLTDAPHLIKEVTGGMYLPEAPFGGVFGTAGDLADAGAMAGHLMEGEWAESGFSAVKLMKSVMSKTPTIAGAWAGVGLDVFEGYVPIGGERQEQMMEATRTRLYGTTELSYEQESEMATRYNGFGVLNYIGDNVMFSAEDPPNLVWGGIAATGDAVGNAIWDAYKGIESLLSGNGES